MRCSPHHYYFGTPQGSLQRHLIPVHVILVRRRRDAVAPKVIGTRRPKMVACAVWRNGLQRQQYRALCEWASVDVRAYRLRMQAKQSAARRA